MLYKLSDIFDLQMGKTPSRDNNMYWKDGNLPWVSIADLSKSQIYIENSKDMITNLAAKDTLMKCIPQDTVIMSFKLSLGKTAITKTPLYTNEAIMAFIDKKVIQIEPIYIYFLFRNIKWGQYTNNAVKGKTLNKKFFSDFQIYIPEYTQQTKIASILIRIDKILEYKHSLIKAYDVLIKSRFVEIFKNNKAHIAIGELFQVIDGDRGKNYPKATDFFDEGYCLFLNAKNVTKNGFCFDTVQFITQQKDEQLNKGRVLPEDIILTTRGTVGNVAYCDIKSSHKHMRINSGMVILRSKDIIYDVDFITYVLSNQINYSKEISGSAQPQLPISKLKDIMIPFPEIFLQKDFGYSIKQINKLKSDVQKSIDETQLLMDSLMQEYFG
ncbi:restriction endonuclease subunit S [Veillonella sp.]